MVHVWYTLYIYMWLTLPVCSRDAAHLRPAPVTETEISRQRRRFTRKGLWFPKCDPYKWTQAPQDEVVVFQTRKKKTRRQMSLVFFLPRPFKGLTLPLSLSCSLSTYLSLSLTFSVSTYPSLSLWAYVLLILCPPPLTLFLSEFPPSGPTACCWVT